MLYYDRIDVFEDISVNKTSPSKEFIICYYHFLDKRLKFQLDLGAQFFFIVYKRWIKEIVTFDNIEIEKGIFHHLQNVIFLEDEDIENI